MLDDDALIDAAEERLLAPGELIGVFGVVADLVVPQGLGKRFKQSIHDLEDIADRLPLRRVMVIDKYRLAALRQLAKHVADDLVLFQQMQIFSQCTLLQQILEHLCLIILMHLQL